jgi:hypothetical protein
LPTLAPISCAKALGTRNAKLLPHFKNSTFMLSFPRRIYNVDMAVLGVNRFGSGVGLSFQIK